METPCLSVVIPTYNRQPILKRCLGVLAEQTVGPGAFEVIVVDDGSTDGTLAALDTWKGTLPYTLRSEAQANQGPAAARNRGLAAARAPWVLFLGDDILATPSLIEQHLTWHTQDPGEELAVLGFITWDPALPITPLMRWLEKSGSQFAFSQMRHGEPVLPGALYTSNLSLAAAFLRAHGGFNEAFRRAAWEDSELHFRLEGYGLRTRYNAHAVAYHHHPTGLRDFLRRSFVTGYELGRARTLHPGRIPTQPLPSPARLRALRLKAPLITALAYLANCAPSLLPSERPFWWLLDYHGWRGLQSWEHDMRRMEGPNQRTMSRKTPSTEPRRGGSD